MRGTTLKEKEIGLPLGVGEYDKIVELAEKTMEDEHERSEFIDQEMAKRGEIFWNKGEVLKLARPLEP